MIPLQTNAYQRNIKRDMIPFTRKRFSEDVVQFTSNCEEVVWSENEHKETNEDNVGKEQEENKRIELRYFFQRLSEYVLWEAPFI